MTTAEGRDLQHKYGSRGSTETASSLMMFFSSRSTSKPEALYSRRNSLRFRLLLVFLCSPEDSDIRRSHVPIWDSETVAGTFQYRLTCCKVCKSYDLLMERDFFSFAEWQRPSESKVWGAQCFCLDRLLTKAPRLARLLLIWCHWLQRWVTGSTWPSTGISCIDRFYFQSTVSNYGHWPFPNISRHTLSAFNES